MSVSLVGSRLVGNACSYYTGKAPLLLAVNRQHIEIDAGGRFHYLGGETPVFHPRHEEIVGTAVHALNVLGCQGYCGIDIVLADRPYVVDVNPRITTSLVGIATCMEEDDRMTFSWHIVSATPVEIFHKKAAGVVNPGNERNIFHANEG